MFSQADRDRWHRAARDAAQDPSMAPEVARMLARELGKAAQESEQRFPIGYTYSGTHKLVARVRNLLPEAIPNETLEGPQTQVPLTSTANQEIPIQVPFNMLVQGVQGWAIPKLVFDENEEESFAWPAMLSCAGDFRDLFSCSWNLNGDTKYTTDGFGEQLVPASVTVGTQNLPRAVFWPLARNQVLNVRFRNIINYYFPPTYTPAQTAELAEAVVVFDCLRLDPP